ncbi:MAG: sensor histidine kinase [Segetibacter sp.]|nr:sensor histidine kinase [Segetibacter sp.]
MSLKFRFTLVFSLLIFIVLTVSSVAIYLLNENFRQEEFLKRVKNEGEEAFTFYSHSPNNIEEIKSKLQYQVFTSLPKQQSIILDASYKTILSVPESSKGVINQEKLAIAAKKNVVFYNDGDRETVILKKSLSTGSIYIVTSAYDFFSRRKNDNLRTILVFTVLGGFLLAGVLALISVDRVITPLKNLQQQIQQIGEKNLPDRVKIPKDSDEVAKIATSFNEMLSRLQHAFESRKNFVQHASHELRTPLATMLAQTESALNQELTQAEYRQVLSSLKEDQQQLIDLTNSLLLLSAYEKQGTLNDRSTVRIDEITYDAIEEVKQLFEHATINVSFKDVPENEDWLSIKGNESLLKSAISNLVKNAVQYSSELKMSIQIDVAKEGVTLHFSNGGIQLPKNEQEKLFLPFFRGDNAANIKGSGLGLSIVQRIITLHGGTVRYQAMQQNVNSFIVYLPGVN